MPCVCSSLGWRWWRRRWWWWGCSDICHNNSHRYQFPFVFTLKFWENASQAYGARPALRHAHTDAHTHWYSVGYSGGEPPKRHWHYRVSLRIGIHAVHHSGDSKHVCRSDAKCIWISARGRGDDSGGGVRADSQWGGERGWWRQTERVIPN